MSSLPETASINQLCEEIYGSTTAESVRQEWAEAVRGVAAKATEVLPHASAERVQKAVKIVLGYGVELLPDNKARVESQSDEGRVYHVVNGSCNCADYSRAPAGWCKHRISRALHLRALRAIRQTTEDIEQVPVVEAPAVETADILLPYVVTIQGKPFVKFAGLLKMAKAHGLVSLVTTWTFNDPELSLAHAVAIFADGSRFEECGDATPTNVNRKVAIHFRRVALTRASSRCLRNSLGVDMVSLEELDAE